MSLIECKFKKSSTSHQMKVVGLRAVIKNIVYCIKKYIKKYIKKIFLLNYLFVFYNKNICKKV